MADTSLFNVHTLPNGLRIIHTTSPTQVVYCGYAIAAGSRLEAEYEQGLAHFVEHMLFKGTAKRRAWHIINRMERVGGELNAYTNKEETVVYAAFMAEHFARAVDLLTDMVFHSTFPTYEIAHEVEVIIDEIKSYEDSPAELIFDDFEGLTYQNHPLGRQILGTVERLKTMGKPEADGWLQRYYHPNNMIFFVHGNLPFSQIVKRLERATADCSQHLVIKPTTALPTYVPQQLERCKQTHQAHVMIGTRSYPAHNEKRTGLYLLNNLLGGPAMNSRLNLSLRERRGLVYTVESNLISYSDTGTFSIYFGCDHTDVAHCIRLVKQELLHLCQKPLTQTELHAAQQQLIGQLAVASDNFESQALEMGKSFLHYGKCDRREEVVARILALTPQQLHSIANELFAAEQLSILCYK